MHIHIHQLHERIRGQRKLFYVNKFLGEVSYASYPKIYNPMILAKLGEVRGDGVELERR